MKVMTESLEVVLLRELTPSHYTSDEVEDVVDALKRDSGRGVWVTLFAQLPAGIHRVLIEGERAQQGLGGLAVDDIKIDQCSEFCKFNLHYSIIWFNMEPYSTIGILIGHI